MSEITLKRNTGTEVVEFLGIPCVAMEPWSPTQAFTAGNHKYQVPLFLPLEYFPYFNKHWNESMGALEACRFAVHHFPNGVQFTKAPQYNKIVLLVANDTTTMCSFITFLVNKGANIYNVHFTSTHRLSAAIFAFLPDDEEKDSLTLYMVADLSPYISKK